MLAVPPALVVETLHKQEMTPSVNLFAKLFKPKHKHLLVQTMGVKHWPTDPIFLLVWYLESKEKLSRSLKKSSAHFLDKITLKKNVNMGSNTLSNFFNLARLCRVGLTDVDSADSAMPSVFFTRPSGRSCLIMLFSRRSKWRRGGEKRNQTNRSTEPAAAC